VDVAVPTEINILSLCSGIGGLDLGVHAALRRMGYAPRTICYVEIEAFAAAILAHQMEQGYLDAAPIWSNLKTFPSGLFQGHVDMVIGGYPCQPFSVAGKRRGEEDPRHLWPFIRDIIGELHPDLCFFENVRGHLKLGFKQVWGDLRGLGHEVECGIFSAAEIGATHRRERLFILAHSTRHGGDGPEWEAGSRGGVRQTGDAMAHRDIGPRDEFQQQARVGHLAGDGGAGFGGAMAHSIGNGSGSWWPKCAGLEGRGAPEQSGPVGNASSAGLQGSERGGPFGEWDRAEAHGSVSQPGSAWLPRFPPGPGDQAAWERVLAIRPDLAPAVESQVCRMADGVSNRVDRLRALGNAVVPAVAEHALMHLMAEARCP
jgi:DNA (cytosine-5)-methyltransferase 1